MPVFACPKCNTPLQLPDQLAGKMFGCPRCGQQLVIPSASTPAAGIQAPAPPMPGPPAGVPPMGAPPRPSAPPAAFSPGTPPPGREPAPRRDDYDDRPRRRGYQDEEVGTIAATSSSSSWSKPLLFGLMGALGCFVAALLVVGPHILLIPSEAPATPGTKTEVSAKADVFFVVDVTGSMDWAIDGVSAGIKNFVDKFEAEKIDVRVGLCIFRDERPFGGAGDGVLDDPWVFRFPSGDVYTKSPDEFKNVLARVRAGGGGDGPENCMEAMRLAAGQPGRKDAFKVQILITDAEPKPWPGYEPNLQFTKKDLQDKNVRQLHLICHNFHKHIYEKLWNKEKVKTKSGEESDKLGGKHFDLRDVAANPRAMDSILSEFKTSIVEEARREAGVASITGGAGATFDKSKAWQLWVASSLLFGFLAFGLAVALVAGQRLYMKQSLLDGAAFVKGLVPLGAGLLAGFLIDLLFTQLEAGLAVGIILRTLGWTVVGAIIGLSMALFVPNLKWYKGLLGGVIGGFAGGLLFNLITLLMGKIGSLVVGTLLGDFLGAIILGFCIGVMVALAEVAFRRWWLEVRYGARETRTVTLGTAPVTVGSDERRATVVVNNAPALVMRYSMDQDRVMCEDLESGRRTELEPGDSRKIGNVTITVCSPDTVVRLGLFLELSNGQKVPLSDGLPLTADDLPGLQANSPDGTVAIVGKKPADPSILLLRNRSKQSWTVRERDGSRQIDPGLGLPLEPGVEINFGRVQGRLVRVGGNGGGGRRRR